MVISWLLVVVGAVGIIVLSVVYIAEKIGSVLITAILFFVFFPLAVLAMHVLPFWAGLVDGDWRILSSGFAAWFFLIVALGLHKLDGVLQEIQDNISSAGRDSRGGSSS